MSEEIEVKQAEIDRLYEQLFEEAEASGYHLNPDISFTKDLIRGLLVNERRYGYRSCPCRLATGIKADDLDIICPCDYRDADITDYGACYCALYVSDDVLKGLRKVESVPERRPPEGIRMQLSAQSWMAGQQGSRRSETGKGAAPTGSVDSTATPLSLPYPIWRCRVCGYLCARDNPPEVCPICKAKKERFERFM